MKSVLTAFGMGCGEIIRKLVTVAKTKMVVIHLEVVEEIEVDIEL